MPNVKCADCGFLSVRNPVTREYEEVPAAGRDNGIFVTYTGDSRSIGGLVPECFVGAYELSVEVTEANIGKSDQQHGINAGLAVIRKMRECASVRTWRRGYSPKEHREMQREDELRQWQVEQKEADRRAREEDKAADRAWQAKQKWHDRIFTIVMAVAGFALGYFFKR